MKPLIVSTALGMLVPISYVAVNVFGVPEEFIQAFGMGIILGLVCYSFPGWWL